MQMKHTHTHTRTHKCANARAPSLSRVQAFLISYLSCVMGGLSCQDLRARACFDEAHRDKPAEATVPLIHMHMTSKLCSPSHCWGHREKYLAEGHKSGWQPLGRRRQRYSRCASGTLTSCVNLHSPISFCLCVCASLVSLSHHVSHQL